MKIKLFKIIKPLLAKLTTKTIKRKPVILFHRDYQSFTGGHLKVWEYFYHVNDSNDFIAKIYFTPNSSWSDNPWNPIKYSCLTTWKPEDSDILFLAGMDWLALSESERKNPPSPVINFIQHVRHADNTNPLFNFLKYPATRICVSQEVADAIIKTGEVNGSVFTNPNGINHSLLPKPLNHNKKDISLLIIGLKNQNLAKLLDKQITSFETYLVTEYLPRDEFLNLVNRAVLTLFLPTKTEGFYLPALEAMYLKSFVICPDCIGNRGFCLNNETCLLPIYSFKAILQAVKNYSLLSQNNRNNIIRNAHALAKGATLNSEKETLLKIISSINY